jgi:SAM-dependent methyltransferase
MCQVMTKETLDEPFLRCHLTLNDLKRIYRNARRIVGKALAIGLQYGLDFGCGSGNTVVLGELSGLCMIGVDIDLFRRDVGYKKDGVPEEKWEAVRVCPYMKIHDALRALGYRIVNRNTNAFPWSEFMDDEFDFVSAYRSLLKNQSPVREADDRGGFNRRLEEIARTIRPGGRLLTDPKGRKAKILGVHQKHFRPKKIKVVLASSI